MKRFIAIHSTWEDIIAQTDDAKKIETLIRDYWDNNAWDTPYEKWRKHINVYKKTKG